MFRWDTRSYARLAVDLAWVAGSPFIALLIRDNFATSALRLEAVTPYALLCILSALPIFIITRLPRHVWRYSSLNDMLHLIAAVTVALLIALTTSFHLNRMENIARSVPVIQWFFLIA